MKIAVPVDESKEKVCVSFGRAPYFLIYDTETKAAEYVVNPAAEAHGGAGIKAAQAVVDSGVMALITVRCGENAAEVLSAGEISIYKAAGATAMDDIKALAKGELEPLTHFHAGYHGIQ